jgi:hypothetical protein
MPLLVLAVVRVTTRCEDECLKSNYGDCGDHRCPGCYVDGADNQRGESLLLKGLSQVTELELSVVSTVVSLLVPDSVCDDFYLFHASCNVFSASLRSNKYKLLVCSEYREMLTSSTWFTW